MTESLSTEELDALLSDDFIDKRPDDFIDICKKIEIEIIEVMAKNFEKNLRKKITIEGTDVFEVTTLGEVKKNIEGESGKGIEGKKIGTTIKYKKGVEGTSTYILLEKTVKSLVNMMIPENDSSEEDESLSELEKDAMNEGVNQTLGNATQKYINMLDQMVEIEPPKTYEISESKEELNSNLEMNDDTEVLYIEYKFEIEDVFDEKIISVVQLSIIEKIYDMIKKNGYTFDTGEVIDKEITKKNSNKESSKTQNARSSKQGNRNILTNNSGGFKRQMYNENNINASPVEFEELDIEDLVQQKENIDIIKDVSLEVSVEMGRTYKKITEILEFAPGTVIELDQLAGDPIDIVVNGKFIAKGEVVVIDENYGIRVTEILNVKNRL